MEDILIVDGYNIINGWPELNKLKEESLEHAREKLIEVMSNYGSFKGVQVIVVFDGHLVKGGLRSSELINGVEVIYTGEGETADAVIEKLMHQLPPSLLICVATSDWSEQKIVLGKGAVRLSGRELLHKIQEINKEAEKFYRSNPVESRALDTHLDAKIKSELEKWRRSK
ncbi:NYN domain-containing protein [Zhaonella formicivorans]|uniref:NYN domain-containing protein n=1 Tax=Zhaonella formicivorans TaxID=2528593 RepID=UPI001D0F73EB|nr:NYN domain-containing protein [Zhaonella formicivorans]